MTRNLIALAALALLASFGSGCQYGKNRYKDFCDITSFGAGTGVGATVQATHYVALSGMTTFNRVRYVGPSVFPPLWFVPGYGMARRIEAPMGPSGEMGLAPLFHFHGNMAPAGHEDRSIVLARTLLTEATNDSLQRWYDGSIWSFFPSIQQYEKGFDRRFFDVGLGLYLGVGVEAFVNPGELVDFFLGWFGADISGDDEHPPAVETVKA